MKTFTDEKDIKKAVGEFKLPKEKTYFSEMERCFTPMPMPKSGDWLYSQK
jgi:hypothetical protein